MKDTINIGDTKEMLCEMLAIPSVSGDKGHCQTILPRNFAMQGLNALGSRS